MNRLTEENASGHDDFAIPLPQLIHYSIAIEGYHITERSSTKNN